MLFDFEDILIAVSVGIFLVLYINWLDKRYKKKNKINLPASVWGFDSIARDKLANRLIPLFTERDNDYQIPIVCLEEFFDGNDDSWSIAANLDPHPTADRIYRILGIIRSKVEVQDILIGIQMVEAGNWPYSDILFVITSAKIETIQGWVSDLRPDALEFCEPSSDSFLPYPYPELNSDMRVAYIWWD